MPLLPKELNVYLTSSCNLSCGFCSLIQGKVEHAKDVTPEMVDRVLSRYPTIIAACIAGFGEPLTSRHVFDVIREVKRHGVFAGLITNGILVPRFIEQLILVRPGYINISLNAKNEDEYRKLVDAKAGDFDLACQGIRLLSGLVKTYVSFVITRKNYRKIPQFMALALGQGADHISFINRLPNAGDRYHNCPQFWSEVITDTDTKILAEIEEFKLLDQEHKVFVWPQPISRTSCPSLCRSPWVSIGINGDGFVSGCRRVAGPARANGHLDDGFENSYFQRERAALLGEGPFREECALCFGNWQAQ